MRSRARLSESRTGKSSVRASYEVPVAKFVAQRHRLDAILAGLGGGTRVLRITGGLEPEPLPQAEAPPVEPATPDQPAPAPKPSPE
jgi:hypothetical protein